MTMMTRLLGATALLTCAVAALPASAQTIYNVTFGTALNAQLTVAPGTGSRAVTGITGTFLGAPITGLVANPYSPATAYYASGSQAVTPTAPTTGNYYYSFDNLLLAGNTFDSDGLFFKTGANVANLFTSGSSQLIYSAVGADVNATPVSGTLTIAAVPEPATWAMMVMGMGALGYALRGRRKITTRVAYAA